MGRYILRRLLWMPVVFLVLLTLSFFIMRLAPGGPFSAERQVDPEILANMEAKYGLDQPLPVQYLKYLGRLCVGDLGPSYKFKNRTVNEIIAQHIWPSAVIGAAATVLALALGLLAGIISAVRQNSVFDYASMSVAMFGMSVPAFVTGPIFVLVFALYWKLLPVSGYVVRPTIIPALVLLVVYAGWRITEWTKLEEPGRGVAIAGLAGGVGLAVAWASVAVWLATGAAVTAARAAGDPVPEMVVPWGWVLLGGVLGAAPAVLGIWKAGLHRGREVGAFLLATLIGCTAAICVLLIRNHELILPSVVLALPFASRIARLMRAGMLEVIHQDYIRTARAKGLAEHTVVVRHALKGGLLPVVSFLGPAMAALLTGSLVVERIFAIPGIGREFVEGATNRDYFVVLGTVVLYGGLLVLFNLVVDIAYGFLDPRISYD